MMLGLATFVLVFFVMFTGLVYDHAALARRVERLEKVLSPPKEKT